MTECPWQDCCECPLSLSRRKTVVPRGGFGRKIMFVGEAPGADEEREGKTFVGKSGKLLNRWIEWLGLTEADVYITNVVKCRPPNNRDPMPEEIEGCKKWLAFEINALSPYLVVPLGRFAKDVLSHMRDENVILDLAYGVALKHPAYYLRKGAYDAPTEELGFLKKRIEGLG